MFNFSEKQGGPKKNALGDNNRQQSTVSDTLIGRGVARGDNNRQ
jgi:hypothetical protein